MGAIEEITMAQRRQEATGKHRLMGMIDRLPPHFCEEAARLILSRPGRVLILTGFFIPQPYQQPITGGTIESDGPAGAYALGQALRKLGYQVTYVTDRYGLIAFEGLPGADDVVDFPITGVEESKRFARELLAEKDPSLVIAIERPGMNAEGKYMNVRGWDISDYVAKLDYLVEHPATIGIIDQGNEIGGGNVAAYQKTITPPLPEHAICLTWCTQVVFGGSCNSGGYAVVAALSILTKRNLLMSAEEEIKLIDGWTAKGMTDGSGNVRSLYDPALPTLNALLRQEGITAP